MDFAARMVEVSLRAPSVCTPDAVAADGIGGAQGLFSPGDIGREMADRLSGC